MRKLVVFVVLIATCAVPGRAAASAPWMWPVVGAIIQGYDPPDDPYGAGHRGIDIAAPAGAVLVAPDDGVVSFAGPVGGRLFLSIDHGGGVVSTSSFLTSLLVRKGDTVVRAQPVATTGWGHAGATVPHLHFGVRLDGEYVDPFAYLGPASVVGLIRLAPLGAVEPAALVAAGRMTSLAYPMAVPRAASAFRAGVRATRRGAIGRYG